MCPQWGHFEDGITNGADWYEVMGGMQDFNYEFSNAMEVTLELSCCKYPDKSRLLPEWENNVASLISYIEQAQRGLRGFVRDKRNNLAIQGAEIQVMKLDQDQTWRAKNVTSDSKGRYWRILLPGTYQVKAVKGHAESEVKNVQVEDSIYTREDFVIDIA